MHIAPFACLRPTRESAPAFAALPYDVYTTEEARAFVAAHPRSFLAIDRAETTLAPGTSPSAPEVYARAHELLEARVADGTLVADDEPCLYVWRLAEGGHAQTGVACAFLARDCEDGTVRRHELTLAAKVADRTAHIRATGCQTGPALLAYRDDDAVAALVAKAAEGTPLLDFEDAGGARDTLWRVGGEDARELAEAFGAVPRAYVADGHHRLESALALCRERRAARPHADGSDPADWLLGVLFPAGELTILPYDRVVADTAGLGEGELVRALESQGLAVGPRQAKPFVPAARGEAGMWAFGAWRRLSLPHADADDPVAELDVSALQDRVLGPVLGIGDPRRDPRVRFVGGRLADGALERAAGEAGVAFALFPTSVGQLMAVADAGRLMPPKSTWFEPKLRSGLLMRRVAEPLGAAAAVAPPGLGAIASADGGEA